jgi:hypothetical protein
MEHYSRRWQFRLWHLFVLTTYVAVVAAVVKTHGASTLVLGTGLLIAVLNRLGVFCSLQAGRGQTMALASAWCLFLISLALPSVVIFGPVRGFAALWTALLIPWESITSGDASAAGLVIFLAIDTANIAMILLPLLLWRLSRARGQILSSILCVAMVAPWCAGWDTQFLVGYYVWSASFMVALIAIPVSRWRLAAMVTLATGLLLPLALQ